MMQTFRTEGNYRSADRLTEPLATHAYLDLLHAVLGIDVHDPA